MTDIALIMIWLTLMWLCSRLYYLTITLCIMGKISANDWISESKRLGFGSDG